MSFYSTIKTIYKIMPKSLKLMRNWVIRGLEKSSEYDEIYDEKYYTDVLDTTHKRSCEVIAESIVKTFSPKSVVDVGCGPGFLLLALRKRGVICHGLDYSSASVNICHQNGLNVKIF